MTATQGSKPDWQEIFEREKREDLERWERYRRTGEFVPHEKVRQWLADVSEGKYASRPR